MTVTHTVCGCATYAMCCFVLCLIVYCCIQDHETGDLQHNPLYKLVHEDIRGFAHYLRETGWIKDGKLLLGQKVCSQNMCAVCLTAACL